MPPKKKKGGKKKKKKDGMNQKYSIFELVYLEI